MQQEQLVLSQSSLGYYATNMLALMKTSGLWAKLRLNATSAVGLDFMISQLDKYCFGKIVYGQARMGWQNAVISPWRNVSGSGSTFTAADIPTSWQAWAALFPPTGPNEDMVHNNDGTFKTANNEYAGQHAEVAYAFMRRDYFPEIAHPLLAQACSMFQAAYDAVAANVKLKAQTATAYDARAADWTYRWPSLGNLMPPVV